MKPLESAELQLRQLRGEGLKASDLTRLHPGLNAPEGQMNEAEFWTLGGSPDLTLLGALMLPGTLGNETLYKAALHALELQERVIPTLGASALEITRQKLHTRLVLRAHLTLNAAQGRRWREHRALTHLSSAIIGSEVHRAVTREDNLNLSPAQQARLIHSLDRSADLIHAQNDPSTRQQTEAISLHPDSDLLAWMAGRRSPRSIWPRLIRLPVIPLPGGSAAEQAAALVLACASRFQEQLRHDPTARVPLPHQRNLIQMEANSHLERGQLSAACADLTTQLCRLQWHHQSAQVSAAVTGALIGLTGPGHPLWPEIKRLVIHLVTRRNSMSRPILTPEQTDTLITALQRPAPHPEKRGDRAPRQQETS